MGDVLNNLTQVELILLREKALNKRREQHCLWCDKEKAMRRDQKFCCANCRVAYAKAAAQVAFDRLVMEKALWEKEKRELYAEIGELRKEIAFLRSPSA